MSVEIFSNENGAVFVCNTSDWAFGPLMPGENVAEAFLKTFQRPDDPRRYNDAELEKLWSDFRKKLTCPYGHFEQADVETYGDTTIFTCMEKGCSAQWNLEGEELCGQCGLTGDECDCDECADTERRMSEAERLGER